MKSCITAWLCPVVLILAVAAAKGAPEAFSEDNGVLLIGNFSAADPADGIPGGWEPLTFDKIDRHTRYQLVDFEGETVIEAKSDTSASGLIRQKGIDPKQYPVVQWRWRATGIYEKGDVMTKSGDDYPARLYIAFEYDPDKVGFFERAKFRAIKAIRGEYPPMRAINYIWASHAPVGTMVPNAYSDRAMMFVVESGKEHANTWVSHSRNIAADYRAAFGEDPPMIQGIAIMTDSDDTGESMITYYGDIVMKAPD